MFSISPSTRCMSDVWYLQYPAQSNNNGSHHATKQVPNVRITLNTSIYWHYSLLDLLELNVNKDVYGGRFWNSLYLVKWVIRSGVTRALSESDFWHIDHWKCFKLFLYFLFSETNVTNFYHRSGSDPNWAEQCSALHNLDESFPVGQRWLSKDDKGCTGCGKIVAKTSLQWFCHSTHHSMSLFSKSITLIWSRMQIYYLAANRDFQIKK